MNNRIITIGIAPCWDKTIEIAGIDWNQHKIISSQKRVPAGKALNINTALAWMGVPSIAAGLWGSDDFQQMKEFCRVGFSPRGKNAKINICLTKVPGRTRENITIVDTANKRQMHFRSKSTLANAASFKLLKKDLQKIITKNSLAVFAGAMPDTAVELIDFAKKKGASVVVDTSGPALKKIVSKGGLFLIKPNIEELAEIIGRKIKNEEGAIISASKKLLTKTKFVLVSRGQKGAILIFKNSVSPAIIYPEHRRRTMAGFSVISARYTGKKYDVCNTVACGDYLLAGFINIIANKHRLALPSLWQGQKSFAILNLALKNAITSASAKAFGMDEKLSWLKIEKEITISMKFLNP